METCGKMICPQVDFLSRDKAPDRRYLYDMDALGIARLITHMPLCLALTPAGQLQNLNFDLVRHGMGCPRQGINWCWQSILGTCTTGTPVHRNSGRVPLQLQNAIPS